MENIKTFFDLEAWQEGHKLVLTIYNLSKSFPKEELFGLTSQLRRAASSITANIAEGFARYHFKDKIRFYYQARGSAAEVQNFLVQSRDLGYISNKQCHQLLDQADPVGRLINGMIQAIKKQKELPVTNY